MGAGGEGASASGHDLDGASHALQHIGVAVGWSLDLDSIGAHDAPSRKTPAVGERERGAASHDNLEGFLARHGECAVEPERRAHRDLDFAASTNKAKRSWFLKLHGSFAWEDAWPIRRREAGISSRPLWIPPGIRKGKERYPFNLLWGLARDVIDCDVLRVIGCRLGPSDWDLISLLFGTRHANRDRNLPYSIEIIDSPKQAVSLQESYPCLDVKSLFEIDTLGVGRNLVGEFLGTAPCRYDTLSDGDTARLREVVERRGNENWFRRWLVQMGEGLQATLGTESTDTDKGAFRRWLEI